MSLPPNRFDEPDYADFDILAVDKMQELRELVEKARDLLIDIDATLGGPYEHWHPRLFARIREVELELTSEVLC